MPIEILFAIAFGFAFWLSLIGYAWYQYGVDPGVEHLWWVLRGRPDA